MPFFSRSFALPRVIGHRGACQYAPENTLSSLRTAHELGVAWIEFDVALTQDEEAIVFHDTSLDRTTNGTGLIAETPYASIAALDAGSWFSAKFVGEKIPTFIDYLNAAAELSLGINVEIKPTLGKEEKTAEKVVKLLRQHWPDNAVPPLVSSFSIVALRRARVLDKQLCLGLLLDNWIEGWEEISKELHCISVHVDQKLLVAETREKIQQIKSYVQYALAYTVDDPNRALELFAMGMDAVFSNNPDIIQSVV